MGIIKSYYQAKYDFYYDQAVIDMEKYAEPGYEEFRDISYEETLSQIAKVIGECSKADLENNRVDAMKQLKETEENIRDYWEVTAHRTTIAATTYNYFLLPLVIPLIVLLILQLYIPALIYFAVALLAIIILKSEPVKIPIMGYSFGLVKLTRDLADLYMIYGGLEAVIEASDYRKICNLDRSRWIYSTNHQKTSS